jgi:hypothetical protein
MASTGFRLKPQTKIAKVLSTSFVSKLRTILHTAYVPKARTQHMSATDWPIPLCLWGYGLSLLSFRSCGTLPEAQCAGGSCSSTTTPLGRCSKSPRGLRSGLDAQEGFNNLTRWNAPRCVLYHTPWFGLRQSLCCAGVGTLRESVSSGTPSSSSMNSRMSSCGVGALTRR